MKNSSRAQSLSPTRHKSSDTSHSISSAQSAQSSLFDNEPVIPGSFDDTSVIRGVLTQSIKQCGLSRAIIAERMTFLLGRKVTDKMLDAFTAESRDDRRWPAEFDRAFCWATGDNTLLCCRAERAGLHVIDDKEMEVLELGRAFLNRAIAEEKIATLQKSLTGRLSL